MLNKKRIWVKMLLFITIIGTLAACNDDTAEESGDKVVIRMANQVEEDNFLNQGYVKFKEYIEEASDGQVSVEIHNGGTIATSDGQIVELLNNNTIDLSTSSAYGTASATGVKGFNLFDMPFLFQDRKEFYAFLDGDYGDRLAEEVGESQNVEVLGYTDLGFYSIMNGSRAVETPEDLKGLKIRTSAAALHVDTFSELGANPTPMDYSEVFTSLQQGTIDGVSTTTPLIYGDRFYEVNKHITLTNHILLPHVLMVNKDFYNGLSEDMKQVFDEAVDVYIEESRKLAIEAEQEAVDGLVEEGVEVTELSPEQLKLFQEAAESVRENNINEVGEENYHEAMELLE